MNCREVLARLYEYLDTELDENDRRSVDDHLEFCTDCLKKYELEKEFNQVVKSKSASQADVAHLKSRVLSEIDKMDSTSGGGSRNIVYLLAPLAAAVAITLFIISPWSSSSPGRVLDKLGPFASEHSKCLGDLKNFVVESADPEEVHAAMANLGVLPQQLFSGHNGDVTYMKGGVAHTKYGTGPHLDYEMVSGNVSIFVLPKDQFEKDDLERVEDNGKVFYFGSCPKYQYVIWECEGQDCVAVSEMDEEKLMGFVTTF